MENSVPLESRSCPEGSVKGRGVGRGEKGDLPEMGLVVRKRSDALRQGLAPPDHQDVEPFFLENPLNVPGLVVRMVSPQIEVGCNEPGVVDQTFLHPFLDEPSTPQGLRNVHLYSASVPFISDLPRAMFHFLKAFESFVKKAMGRSPVFRKNGDDGTTVPFLIGKRASQAADLASGSLGLGHFLWPGRPDRDV